MRRRSGIVKISSVFQDPGLQRTTVVLRCAREMLENYDRPYTGTSR